MLHLIYGTNASGRHDAKEAILQTARGKNTTFIIRTGADLQKDEIEQLAQSSSLFGEKFVAVLEYPFENEEFGNFLIDHLDMLEGSETIFIISERELTKDYVKAFEKAGARIVHKELPKEVIKKDFNIFSLTDAFCERNKKDAWIIFSEAIARGKEPEEIAGVLFWSVKNMLLVQDKKNSNDLASSGLNPFVAGKAFRASKKWTKDELENISRELVRITHESKNGTLELVSAIESLILQKL
jgi:DNA polymerase III delta subunit